LRSLEEAKIELTVALRKQLLLHYKHMGEGINGFDAFSLSFAQALVAQKLLETMSQSSQDVGHHLHVDVIVASSRNRNLKQTEAAYKKALAVCSTLLSP
jgi:hypothetical protein